MIECLKPSMASDYTNYTRKVKNTLDKQSLLCHYRIIIRINYLSCTKIPFDIFDFVI